MISFDNNPFNSRSFLPPVASSSTDGALINKGVSKKMKIDLTEIEVIYLKHSLTGMLEAFDEVVIKSKETICLQDLIISIYEKLCSNEPEFIEVTDE